MLQDRLVAPKISPPVGECPINWFRNDLLSERRAGTVRSPARTTATARLLQRTRRSDLEGAVVAGIISEIRNRGGT